MRTVEQSFSLYRQCLSQKFPWLDERVNGPADESWLRRYEELLGFGLPDELRALWMISDGESMDGPAGGTVGGMVFLSVADSYQEWATWAAERSGWSELDAAGLSEFSESSPPDAIRLEYSSPGWIPLLQEYGGANYIGVDCAPGTAGTPGQLINFGRDEDQKCVIAETISDLLSFLTADMVAGKFIISTSVPAGEPYIIHRQGELLQSVLYRTAVENGPVR